MSEQSKIDAERAAFEAWAKESASIDRNNFHPEFYEYLPTRRMWDAWQARASLPVGVPDGSIYVECRQCDVCQHGGINDAAAGLAACHDCDWTGPDPVEDKCPGCQSENCMAAACPKCGSRYVLVASEDIAAPATPTVKAEQPDMADAYVGAREDLTIWKRRALEAEQKARRQEQIIDHLTLEAQGETRFGEPSMPSAQPVAVIEYAGYDPANSIKWLNKGLQYMEPGTLLYAQAPSMPAAGSAVEEVEVVGYRFFHVDHGYIFRRTHIYEGNPSLEAHSLMTVAQHKRIVAQLAARDAGEVRVLLGLLTILASEGLSETESDRYVDAVMDARALLAQRERGGE